MNKEQITDLLKRLIYRLKQKEELQASNKKENEEKEKPVFKAGNALPAVVDSEPEQPSKDKLADKAKQMFDDLDDYDDDFEESGTSKGGNNFNANELLNFSDYQNRRRETAAAASKSGNQTLNIKDVLNGSAAQKLNNQYDGEIEVDDDWGDDWGEDEEEEIKEVDKKLNLNKLSDAQLAAHKRAMDKDFNANQVRPGDPGYVYDKVVDFANAGRDSPLGDDSWGEESEADAEAQDQEAGEDDGMRDYGEDDDDMDYFDDDFS